jgi:hypothetical protein
MMVSGSVRCTCPDARRIAGRSVRPAVECLPSARIAAAPRWGPVQSIEGIGAEDTLLNHFLKILVGRGDHSHVHRRRAAAAPQTLNLPLLEHSEQFGLQFQRQIADFVQEQRAAVRGLKSSDRLRDSAREGTSFVAEQFAFEQADRNRRSSPPRNAGDDGGRRGESPRAITSLPVSFANT